MPEGVEFPFPSLLFYEGRTYGQPEVVRISLPQVATGLRFACRARSVGGTFSRTKLCTWMAATCAVALHSSQRAVLQTAMCRIRQNGKAKPAYAVFQYHMGRWYDGDFSSFH